MPKTTFKDNVFIDELDAIKAKRRQLKQETQEVENNLMGIALSGGGVRSATINLGFLKVMNRLGLLKKMDYISSVSGGGYIGSYVHETLRKKQQTEEDPYDALFQRDDIAHLRAHGNYLTPHNNPFINYSTLLGGYLVTGVLHLLWYVLFALLISYTICWINPHALWSVMSLSLLVLLSAYYYFFHFLYVIPLFKKRLWSPKYLMMSEGIFTLFLLFLSVFYLADNLTLFLGASVGMHVFILLCLTIFFGIFANPNILSSHMFYNFRLKDAYLWSEKPSRKIHDLNPGTKADEWGTAPYPLINTTLNLMGKDKYQGLKTCDYFMFSPLYSGSKLTGYVPSHKSEYETMSLATAMSISGAAVNSNMGYKSNRFLAFFMTLLNIRLGYWVLNPKVYAKSFMEEYEQTVKNTDTSMVTKIFLVSRIQFHIWAYSFSERFHYWPTFWPYTNLSELFGISNLKRWRINLSDGGHIENLGAYELLKRRCKLILSVDAGADPEYGFSDLKNLVIRARNELGLAIEFRTDPEETIKPKPSIGFSTKQYAVADVYDTGTREHIGLYVYIKSSLTLPAHSHKGIEKSDSHNYKTYHPTFPHESTGDQFFDTVQWDAYYALGRQIGFAILSDVNEKLIDQNETDLSSRKIITETEIYELFNALDKTFKGEESVQ